MGTSSKKWWANIGDQPLACDEDISHFVHKWQLGQDVFNILRDLDPQFCTLVINDFNPPPTHDGNKRDQLARNFVEKALSRLWKACGKDGRRKRSIPPPVTPMSRLFFVSDDEDDGCSAPEPVDIPQSRNPARGSVGKEIAQEGCSDDEDAPELEDFRQGRNRARGSVGIEITQDDCSAPNTEDIQQSPKRARGSVTIEIAQESSSELVRCPSKCGYYRTWHDTHCCSMCASNPGVHGPRCDRVPTGEVGLCQTQTLSEWSQRILELARFRNGMHIMNISGFWKEKWPNDNIDEFKPCKKLKAAVQRAQSVDVRDDRIYVPAGMESSTNLTGFEGDESDEDDAHGAASSTTHLNTIESQWSHRIFELATENNGMHVGDVNGAWKRKWPSDDIADYRPCKKIKKALSRVKIVELRQDRVYVPGLPEPVVAACPKLPVVASPFAASRDALAEVLHTVADGHRCNQCDAEMDLFANASCREAEQAISRLVCIVRDLLEGTDSIPLTHPEWASSKVLYWSWAYASAVGDLELRPLSRALSTAFEAVLGSAEDEAEEHEISEKMFATWESLLGQCIRVMPKRVIGREAVASKEGAQVALEYLSTESVPKRYKYSAHFLRSLHYERLEEIYAAVQEVCDEDENKHALICEGKWSSKLHRAELDLLDWHPTCESTSSSNVRRASNLRKHDLVLLTPRYEGAQHDLAEGIVAELRKDFEEGCPLQLKLWNTSLPGVTNPISTAIESLRFTAVALRSVPITFDRQVEAIKAVSKRNGRAFHSAIRDLIVQSWEDAELEAGEDGITRKSPKELAAEIPDDAAVVFDCGTPKQFPLSLAQEAAVLNACNRRCSLIRGPPGTGKTHTACAIVQRWLEQGANRVLVVAQSNVAALNIQERMASFGVPCARVGTAMLARELQQQQSFLDALDPATCQRLEQEDPDRFLSQAILMPMTQKVIHTVPVVVMTCITSGNGSLLQGGSFSRVLIDEAAQSTEPTSLVPLMTGAKAFVCIGDDRQLPATIHSMEAKRLRLDESLFERLLRVGVVSEGDGFQQLDIQRRMHSTIAEFPGRRFYGGKLQNGCHDEDRPPIQGFNWPRDGHFRVCFVDMDGVTQYGFAEDSSGKSTQNSHEAELLASVLSDILCDEANNISLSDIAVITGYSAQRRLLRSKVPQSIRVDTVDGFQGMERDLVLVSTVRSNSSGKVGFLSDERRANVLLTRARCGLIVFGSYSTLHRERLTWGPWLDWIYEMGAAVSHDKLSA